MSLARHIMRIAGAAVVFAVLACASVPAMAHGGHSHGPAIEKQAPAAVKADASAAAQAAEHEGPEFTAAAGAPDSEQDKGAGCSGTCCKSAMACCSVIFAESGETPSPPGVATRLRFPSSDSWTSLTPDRLRRPPKSFA
jgi:hypothetical protein